MRGCLLALALVVLAAPQAEAFYFDFRLGSLPLCDDTKVLSTIATRFNNAETRRLHDGAVMGAIEAVEERDVVAYGPRPIERRYCRAKAWVGDKGPSTMHYLIEAEMGLAGTGWNVEFCVVGHDNWRVYGGSCRVLRRHRDIID